MAAGGQPRRAARAARRRQGKAAQRAQRAATLLALCVATTLGWETLIDSSGSRDRSCVLPGCKGGERVRVGPLKPLQRGGHGAAWAPAAGSRRARAPTAAAVCRGRLGEAHPNHHVACSGPASWLYCLTRLHPAVNNLDGHDGATPAAAVHLAIAWTGQQGTGLGRRHAGGAERRLGPMAVAPYPALPAPPRPSRSPSCRPSMGPNLRRSRPAAG